MDPKNEARILKTLEQIRQQTKALMIVGFTEDDRFFYSVDAMVSPGTVFQMLRDNATPVADSVAKRRQRNQTGGSR